MLLEPIMLVTLSVPEESVGDVIGDLNSPPRAAAGHGARLGGMTEVKAEVPMAEMLTYAPDLRALTGGQGDYTMEFLRYEEVPGAPRRRRSSTRRARRPRPSSAVARRAACGRAWRRCYPRSAS